MAEKSSPLVSSLIVFFLIAFFGCGAVVVANLFFNFLSEEVLAMLGLGMLATIFVLAVVGKCVSAVKLLRPAPGLSSELSDDKSSES